MRRVIGLWGCLLVLVAWSARAEPPSGAYTVSIGEDDGLAFPSGTVEVPCVPTRDGDLCLSTDVTTDASGLVTGASTLELTGPVSLDIALALDGKLSGNTVYPRAVIDFTASGTASIEDPNQPTDPNAPPNPPLVYPVDGRGRIKCALGSVADELQCAGKARLCVYEDGRLLGCDKLPFTTPLPVVRTPFDVVLDLATSARNAVTGSAEVRIGDAPVFSYSAKGKYRQKDDSTTLKLASAEKAVKTRIALKKVQLAGGAAGSGLVLFSVAGQKGAVLLTPLTFTAGH